MRQTAGEADAGSLDALLDELNRALASEDLEGMDGALGALGRLPLGADLRATLDAIGGSVLAADYGKALEALGGLRAGGHA
jgi:hypothetical protein